MKIDIKTTLPTIQPGFEKLYFFFGGCKKDFNKGCKFFITVDICHFKTKYDGQLLVDVSRDPNDQYYTLAFRVLETKIKESGKWF